MEIYDSDVLNEMADEIDLLDYASNTLNFKKRGINTYGTNCPLHNDKTPSLMINTDNNNYHCYSCGVHGNIYNWLRDFEGLTFQQAVQKVSKLTGSDIKNLKCSETVTFFKKMRNLTKLSNSTSFDDSEVSKREILPPDTMDTFLDEIPQEWIDEGIDADVMRLYGVRIDSKANRIVYPVYDKERNLIAVKGRTRYPNYKQLGLQKYMFYQKIGKLDFFVGWQEAMFMIDVTKEVYLFEGIKSCMKAYSWGYQNSLSCETSHISDGQIKWLIQHDIKIVNICFDSDAKIKEIKKNISTLKKFLNIYLVADKRNLLGGKEAKASPVDKGKDIWESLLKERVLL